MHHLSWLPGLGLRMRPSVLVARFAPHLIAFALISFFKNICGIYKHHKNKGLKFFHGKYDWHRQKNSR
jgi:hypothetical protein